MLNNKLYGICGGIGCGKDEVTRIIQKIGLESNLEFKNRKFAYELKRLIAFILDISVELLEDRHFKETPIKEMEIRQIHYQKIDDTNNNSYSINLFSSLFNEKMINEYLKPGYEYSGFGIVDVSPRWLMYNIGTLCFRDIINKDFWVWKSFKDYTSESLWVFSDVRYPKNEGGLISINKGLLIGVRRKFSLRCPKYKHLEVVGNPYEIPYVLKDVDRKLYLELMSDSELASQELSWCDVVIENDGSLDELEEKIREVCLKK